MRNYDSESHFTPGGKNAQKQFPTNSIRLIIAERVSRRGCLLGSAIGIGAVAAQGFVGSLFSDEAMCSIIKTVLSMCVVVVMQ